MKHAVWALALVAGIVCAQQPGDFQPAETNVWGAEYPRVDANGRVQVRIKAPEANKVKLNFWSGPKVDMEKQADGFWTVTTTPLVPGVSAGSAALGKLTVSSANGDGTVQLLVASKLHASAVKGKSGQAWRTTVLLAESTQLAVFLMPAFFLPVAGFTSQHATRAGDAG